MGRCDQAGPAGAIRLAAVRCPAGLAFDVDRQTCDWKSKVLNCDRLEKPRKPLPLFKTEEPICPEKHLACGNRECIEQKLFCGIRQNPNGCQVKGTFFVSHRYTNYSAVQDF